MTVRDDKLHRTATINIGGVATDTLMGESLTTCGLGLRWSAKQQFIDFDSSGEGHRETVSAQQAVIFSQLITAFMSFEYLFSQRAASIFDTESFYREYMRKRRCNQDNYFRHHGHNSTLLGD